MELHEVDGSERRRVIECVIAAIAVCLSSELL